MSETRKNRKVLFAGSLSASRSNALGVQMHHLAEPFGSSWVNCYWYDDGKGPSQAPSAHPLYSKIPNRWPFVAGRGFVSRMSEQLGIDWWQNNRLIEWKKPKLKRMLGDIGFAYVAPLWNSDATRCRELMLTLGCPFVVHVWDILDHSLNEDYGWLLANAEHVFCLSSTMINMVRAAASCESSLLAFCRPPSQFKARQYADDSLKIGLIGTLFPYPEGPELLSRAVAGLRAQYHEIHLKYVGSESEMRFIPEDLKSLTECTGFLNDDGRDAALAECNVGYLPGPLLSPEQDARSRHSIPSRSADYMAVGLPVIAAVHPLSATDIFFDSIRGRGFFPVREPEEICSAVKRLRDETYWMQATEACTDFFEEYFDKRSAQNRLLAIATRYL